MKRSSEELCGFPQCQKQPLSEGEGGIITSSPRTTANGCCAFHLLPFMGGSIQSPQLCPWPGPLIAIEMVGGTLNTLSKASVSDFLTCLLTECADCFH